MHAAHEAPLTIRPRPGAAYAIREAWANGYGAKSLRRDVVAGVVVGIIALPLSMALAIAVGANPEHGIYTAIVAGFLAALCGGSRVQVTGPTAAFVVILAPIVHDHGLGGLMVATALAGVMLIGLGWAKLGKAISLVPFPVVTGFTAGIAIVIAILQVRDFLGLSIATLPDGTVAKVVALGQALATVNWADAAVGVVALVTVFAWPKLVPRIPGALATVVIAILATWAIGAAWPGAEIHTIATRFGSEAVPSGIPSALPSFQFPWLASEEPWTLAMMEDLAVAAMAIALLGAIESLLSSVVADGMTGHRSDPDAELMGQGIANVGSAFFGGIAATGAIARTAANVRAGGNSPVASAAHAVFLALALLILGRWLGEIPLAAMAALLLGVALHMADVPHFVRSLRSSPGQDVIVMLTCTGLTVVTDMVVAVFVGIGLAGLLFIRRMTEVSSVNLVSTREGTAVRPVPGVHVYDVSGPLFFGAAQRAMAELDRVDPNARVVVLDLEDVPAIDATGLVNLESAALTLRRKGIAIVIMGLTGQPLSAVRRATTHWKFQPAIVATMDEALRLAESLAVEVGERAGRRRSRDR